MKASDISDVRYGDRLTHVESGTPAVVERIDLWSDGRTEVTVRFAGDPRTDPWGPFREAPMYSADSVRDLERIVIERDHLGGWERASATPV